MGRWDCLPVALVLAAAAPAGAEDWACAGPAIVEGRVSAVVPGPAVAVRGADGEETVARLAGVVVPDPAADGADPMDAVLRRLEGLVGAAVLLRGDGAERDRYGRVAGVLLLTDGEAVQGGLLEGGLAVASGEGACAAPLLAAEAPAREAGRGVWSGPLPADARDPALAERTPGFLVVEGRVDTVGLWHDRAYLNFGGRWSDDFTVVVAGLVLDELGGDSFAMGLAGRFVRVRGWAEPHNGVEIRLRAAAALEIVDRPAGDAGGPR
jgi:endonuclease YncB( thermonuclease family)